MVDTPIVYRLQFKHKPTKQRGNMEELARLEEQVSLICEAYDALEGVVEELDLHHIKELTTALEKLTQIRVEIEQDDIPAAKELAAKAADAELAELHSTYRWQQGF